MKAILKYPLYRRINPGNDTDPVGFLDVHSLIDADKVIAGKEIDGISIWYYSTDGFYYWGGGIQAIDGSDFFSWNTLSDASLKESIITSIVNDEGYWLEKRVTDYLGCGMGFKNDNPASGLALTIFVGQKNNQGTFPKTITYRGIADIPTDIKPVQHIDHHVYRAGGLRPIAPDLDSPVSMGGSISLQSGTTSFGSRGLLLRKNNEFFLLTCFHVLLGQFKPKGEFPFPGNIVVLTASYPSANRNIHGIRNTDVSIVAGKYSNRYDFALVRLSNGRALSNAFGNLRFTGFHDATSIKTLLNKQVTMAGAVSILQTGTVLDTKATIFVGPSKKQFDNVVVTERISTGGDSGGPVIDSDNKIVGIIIAGNDNDKSFILPIYNLVFQQGYEIVF